MAKTSKTTVAKPVLKSGQMILKSTQKIVDKDVYVANIISRASQCLTLTEKRILFAGIAKLNGKNGMITLTAEEYSEAYGIDLSTAYTQLKTSFKQFFKRQLTWQVMDGEAIGMQVTTWLAGYQYFNTKGYVNFMFNPLMFPFIFDLKREFTKYQLKQASALRSIYSWRMLELLEQHNKIDDDGYRWLKIPLDEFYHAMEVPESYKKTFGMVRRTIIEPAVKELSEKDGWLIEWQPLKESRKVYMLYFRFRRNPQGSLFSSKEAPTPKNSPKISKDEVEACKDKLRQIGALGGIVPDTSA